jgi:hypothetical protein
MQRVFLFAMILMAVFAAGCKPSQSGESSGTTGGNQGPKHKVVGQVLYTRAYCGGAAPSEQMLERYRTPAPLAGLTLYLRAGRTNILNRPIVDSTVTDGEGRFVFNLPKGEYCIITKARLSRPKATKYDPSQFEISEGCVDDWIVNCDATFTVADQDVEGLGLQFYKECFKEEFNPCIHYIGPMPP